jgi:hypothetical protein
MRNKALIYYYRKKAERAKEAEVGGSIISPKNKV